MQRDRSKAISVELNKKAKEIYDYLPKHIKKGEFLSDAIIEKNQRESNQSYITQEQFEELENRVKKLEEKK